MKLRHLLKLVVVGFIFLPLAGAFIFNVFTGYGVTPTNPVARYIQTRRSLEFAFEILPDGSLSPKPGHSLPDWLSVVVADTDGFVVYSALPAVQVGTRADFGHLTEIGHDADRSRSRFIMENLVIDGKEAGRFVAFFEPGSPDSENQGLWIGRAAAALIILLLLFGAGGLAATRLARSVRRLEDAAARISAGDLDSPVAVRGVDEVVSLSSAMDRMRISLKENQAARSRFLAAISHDLRTPLTAMRGYVEAIGDGMADNPETMERYVDSALDKGRILEGRIDELLEFAKMETGEWVMRFEDLPLKAFLDRLASEYRDEAAAAGRQFSSAILLPEDLRVSADARLLERAFENLFTNALRYVPVGAGMHLRSRIDGEGLILRFDDEGPGIAPEELPRIFEPYYRGSGDGRQDGLGLGLYIASSIIRGHGWSLEASSKPGEGAVFTISVPASGIRS